ncbi:hypothetical protein C8Q76DRAFT_586905, partial [Earliella scabrosa]
VEIFEYLDADSLVRIRHTSSLGHKYVSVTLRRRVRRLFRNRLERYHAFLEWFTKHGCVISGEAALHVLFPANGIPSTIDIYVREGLVDSFVEYFPECESFVHIGSVIDTLYYCKDDLIIAVHRVKGANPLFAVTSQLHSGLLNYVTATSFCSAYPILTRERRALLNPDRLIDLERIPKSLNSEVVRWARSRWTLSRSWIQWAPGLSCNGPRSAGCATAQRHFQDASCSWGSLDLVGSCRGLVCQCDSGKLPLRWVPAGRNVRMRDTVVWWRGGRTCTAECHGGGTMTLPHTRTCHWSLLG